MSSFFITLTYDTRYIPITDSGYFTLDKRDCQLFFKRLRRAHKNQDRKIKYYLCGEYGGRTMRPHYHIILFNCSIELLQGAWDKGRVHYGVVSGASVGYTLKYMCKPRKIPMFRGDDRLKEFSLMSKKLGVNYVTESMVKWHKKDVGNRMYCNLTDGRKIAMPRYYKEKIFTPEEREIAAYVGAVKAKNDLFEYHDKMVKEFGEDWEQKERENNDWQYRKMYKSAEKGREIL